MKIEIPRSEKLRLELGGPCWLKLRAIGLLLSLILLPGLAGCFKTDIKPYPSNWSPVVTIAAGQCPDISGEYQNSGDWDADSRSCGRKYPPKTAWNCDSSLAGNLVKMKAVEWSELSYSRNFMRVKLQQPDPDTLAVYIPSEGSPPKIFKRSKGDFDCDSSGLRFSTTGNALSLEGESTGQAIVRTTAGLLALSGAVVSTERVFRPLQDGSLSMEVTESVAMEMTMIFFLYGKNNAFVRWERYQPPPQNNINSGSP